MPRKGRSNEEIVHALHQVEGGEKVNIVLDGAFNTFKWVLGRRQQLKIWEEELKYLLERTAQLYDAEQGITPDYNIVQGVWEWKPKREIMTHVCGHAPTSLGFCQ